MQKKYLFKGIWIRCVLQVRLGDGSLFLGELPVYFGEKVAKNIFLQFKGKICINKLNSFIFIPILTTRNK